MQGLAGRLRRLGAPELLDDHVAGDGLALTQREQGEQGAMLFPTQLDDTLAVADLERPEQQEIGHVQTDCGLVPPRQQGRERDGCAACVSDG